MLFESLYTSKTTQRIIELINEQPDPSIFYKSLFELDGTNLVSIMSFEGKSMQYMLSDKFESHFTSEYPLFYKNKI